MQITFNPSALAVVLASSLALAGCSTPTPPSSQKWVPAVDVPPPDPEDEEPETIHAERLREREEDRDIKLENQRLGVDDYRHENGMTIMSSEPGFKNRRQLEVEKIHRLAKMCIQANNVSPPCLEIVKLNIRAGKFFILQETTGYDADISKMRR